MKHFFCISLLLFTFTKASAQTDEYDRLIAERNELIKEYADLNAQNSNFWGKKSKKDLLKIIDNLKAIIQKDSEVINSVQASYIKRNADLTVKTEKMQTERQSDTRMISENITDMKRQVANLESRDKLRLQKIAELEETLKDTKAAKTEHDLITVFTSLAALFLLFYVLRLRKKLKAKRA